MKCSNLMAGIFAAATVAACAAEPSGPRPDLTPVDAKGSGGTRVYMVTIEGDITLPSSGGEVFVTRSATDPFANSDITLKNVTFSIGPLGPSGDDALCAAAYPNAFNNTNGGAWPDGWNGNEGEWTGSATISEKRQIVNVSGSRSNETVQSSQSFGMTKAQGPDGSWSLTFDNALQFFGSTSTHFDGQYRCLDFRVVLTPV